MEKVTEETKMENLLDKVNCADIIICITDGNVEVIKNRN